MIQKKERKRAPTTEYSDLTKPQIINLNIPIIFEDKPNNILVKSSVSDFYMRLDLNSLDNVYMEIMRYTNIDENRHMFIDYDNILFQLTIDNVTHSISKVENTYKIVKTNHINKTESSVVMIDLVSK